MYADDSTVYTSTVKYITNTLNIELQSVLEWLTSNRLMLNTLHGQKYGDPCLLSISFQNHGHQYGVGTPFAAITASTFLGMIFTRCWNIAVGTCLHSATRALARSGTDVGRLGLARIRHSNSSQRYSMGLRSGLCAGQSSFSTPISTNPFCMDLALCMGHCHSETGKGLPQTFATNLEAQNHLECYL